MFWALLKWKKSDKTKPPGASKTHSGVLCSTVQRTIRFFVYFVKIGIPYNWVMYFEKRSLEVLWKMDSDLRVNRCSVCLAESGRQPSVSANRNAAAPQSPSHSVSHCLDYSLCTDGNWGSPDPFDRSLRAPESGSESVYCTIDREFFLEFDFLQCNGILFFLFLASASLGTCAVDDRHLENRRDCCLASDSISALVDIRRLSKSGSLVAEPLTCI